MKDLTEEEKEMLAELAEKKVINIPSRTHGQTSAEKRKLALLKELVYKDVISFSALPEPERNHVFFYRSEGLDYR